MVANLPNYRAVYRGAESHAVEIYIAESLEEKLESNSFTVRNGAMKSVCIRFGYAYEAKYGRHPGFVEARSLVITRLLPKTAVTTMSASPATRTAKPAVAHCCGMDSCVPCDLGYHSAQCRNGCTIP